MENESVAVVGSVSFVPGPPVNVDAPSERLRSAGEAPRLCEPQATLIHPRHTQWRAEQGNQSKAARLLGE